MSFLRRMLDGTAILRQADGDGGAPALDPNSNADGGTPAPGATPSPTAGAASGEGTTPPGGANPDGAPSPSPSATPSPAPADDPIQRRMNQLVGERWAERRAREAAEQRERLLQQQLNETRAALQPQPTVDADGNPVQPTQQPAPRVPAAPIQDVQAMAQEIARQNQFNTDVTNEVQRGRGVHTDFDQVAANLQRFGDLPRTFVEACLATGKGADVIYELGKNIVEADRILALPPMQQAVAVAQLAGAIKAPEPPKTVTTAPDPVVPRVGGGKTQNSPSLEDADLPIADWIKLREKNLPKAGARR